MTSDKMLSQTLHHAVGLQFPFVTLRRTARLLRFQEWPRHVPGTPSVLFLLGNFTPKTSNYCLKNRHLAFQVAAKWKVTPTWGNHEKPIIETKFVRYSERQHPSGSRRKLVTSPTTVLKDWIPWIVYFWWEVFAYLFFLMFDRGSWVRAYHMLPDFNHQYASVGDAERAQEVVCNHRILPGVSIAEVLPGW